MENCTDTWLVPVAGCGCWKDQIGWVLTSYIVAAAIMTPPTGYLSRRFGLKQVFLVSVAGFTVASMLCGMAQSLVQIQKELVWPFFVGANATQKTADDYWTPDNPNARYPRLYGQGGNSNNQMNSSWWYWSSSYLRLKSVELGYTLPALVINKIKLKSVRIYVSGLNLFTVSPVKDFFDPEMGQAGGGDNNARGWYYPQQKVVTAGLNVNF